MVESSNPLDHFELSGPQSPSFDPRLGIMNREHHKLFVNQFVPIVISAREMPATKNCVNIGLEIDRKLGHPDAVILFDDVPAPEIVVVANMAIPAVVT